MSAAALQAHDIGRRADYTFRHNLGAGRHGWLRLTPAYSVKIVEEILGRFNGAPQRIIDPFSGTATTALCAANHGHDACALDINPFLQWLGHAKLGIYRQADLARAQRAGRDALRIARRKNGECTAPPLYNIERWWNAAALLFLSRLKTAIEETANGTGGAKTLLDLAFCRTMILISNAAFNHQSISFRKKEEPLWEAESPAGYENIFSRNLEQVVQTAAANPLRPAIVAEGDARCLESVFERRFNLIITSPPYANRMSYIRELRPYMYWLGFLTSGREAGELDWQAIGGTWGAATSRLAGWTKTGGAPLPDYLEDAIDAVARRPERNSGLMANYAAKYFEDVFLHLQSAAAILEAGAEVHYIVGNSVFYGVLLSSEKIYADFLKSLGFDDVHIRVLRKRNSKKELYEFAVSAKWPG